MRPVLDDSPTLGGARRVGAIADKLVSRARRVVARDSIPHLLLPTADNPFPQERFPLTGNHRALAFSTAAVMVQYDPIVRSSQLMRPRRIGEQRGVVSLATLAADHRASDGHRGGLFLAAIDRLLQTPEKL